MSSPDFPRSEMLFVTDAQDCNPNGNPLAEDRPRRDPETGQGIVTDVRLKRYLRDQLLDDGYGVYVKKVDGESQGRKTLTLDILDEISEASDIEEVEDIGKKFLSRATDVRYFGAALTFESSDDDDDDKLQNALQGAFPNQYQGPVQFLPAKSLNKVEENQDYDSLTSVIATDDENRQGGFGLDDHRIVYGIFPFYGLVDENAAADTNLTKDDVERLDTLCWRALKNQPTSRSKLGQTPRLYLRVVYEEGKYHTGNLHNMIDLADESSDPLRSIDDVVVTVDSLCDRLETEKERIDKIRFVGDSRFTLSRGGETFGADEIGEKLHLNTEQINVYKERDLADE
ncbi:type I-B CRISPR-associated protein Cas7/Csh2 [Halobaculum sp. MBLA0147]|uniref:type I-B CRISPR-associated protein Cas7/Csh2 n=1 Tax=Halobaculum sp. MBLA0147 TaxID=3079934 RepID=UPI0035266667